MEMLDVVNSGDKIIGVASKDDVYDKLLTHRIVHVIVFNSKKELALQLRSDRKKSYPGYWDISASGHVISGETYKEAAERELKEELGIKTKLEFLYKFNFNAVVFWNGRSIKKFITVFKTRYEGPFRIKSEEVKRVKFFSLKDIENMIKEARRCIPNFCFCYRSISA